jgi:hypothetical protein
MNKTEDEQWSRDKPVEEELKRFTINKKVHDKYRLCKHDEDSEDNNTAEHENSNTEMETGDS